MAHPAANSDSLGPKELSHKLMERLWSIVKGDYLSDDRAAAEIRDYLPGVNLQELRGAFELRQAERKLKAATKRLKVVEEAAQYSVARAFADQHFATANTSEKQYVIDCALKQCASGLDYEYETSVEALLEDGVAGIRTQLKRARRKQRFRRARIVGWQVTQGLVMFAVAGAFLSLAHSNFDTAVASSIVLTYCAVAIRASTASVQNSGLVVKLDRMLLSTKQELGIEIDPDVREFANSFETENRDCQLRELTRQLMLGAVAVLAGFGLFSVTLFR